MLKYKFMKKDIQWFRDRKNKEVIRTYKNNKVETKVIICGEKTEDYCKYFHDLQSAGFEFRDTGANIAAALYTPQEPEIDLGDLDKYKDDKVAARPKISISEGGLCLSCES